MMTVLRKGGSYRFSVLDPQRGNWTPGWQYLVDNALALRGWTGKLTWLRDPVPWWTVLPSLRCGKDAVLVWLDVEVDGADLPVALLEDAMNEVVGCLEFAEVGENPGLPPDHAAESAPVPTPRWLKALIAVAVLYFSLSVLSVVASLTANARRLFGVWGAADSSTTASRKEA